MAKSVEEIIEEDKEDMRRQQEESYKTVTSDSAETHILIQTLGCGDIIAPLSHITNKVFMLAPKDRGWNRLPKFASLG